MGTADGAFNVLVRVGGEAEPPFSLAGAFNVLLNSLAVSFCLDVDDQLSSSTSVLPRSLLRRFDVSGNGKRPLVDDEALWAPIARALLTHAHPDRVRRQLDLTPMLVVGSSFVTLLVSAWEMQSKTSWGEKFVWYDDDNKIATASPFWASGSENHYTAVPKWMFHAFLVIFTASMTLTRRAIADEREQGDCKHAGLHLFLWFAFEYAVTIGAYQLFITIVVDQLILRKKGPGFLADCAARFAHANRTDAEGHAYAFDSGDCAGIRKRYGYAGAFDDFRVAEDGYYQKSEWGWWFG